MYWPEGHSQCKALVAWMMAVPGAWLRNVQLVRSESEPDAQKRESALVATLLSKMVDLIYRLPLVW